MSPQFIAQVGPRKPYLARVAEEKLRTSPYYFLRQVDCDYADGVITLRGRVPVEQLCRCAEAIVARIDGVEAVMNCLEVGDPFSGVRTLRSAG